MAVARASNTPTKRPPPYSAPRDPSVRAATLGDGWLAVRQSALGAAAGRGLFARRGLRKGTVLCEYAGTRLTLAKVLRTTDKSYVMGGFGLNCHIDGQHHTEFHARYINDHADPAAINARFVKCRKTRKALVVALRDIRAGEEVYCSYGEAYWRAAKYPMAG